MKTIFVFPKRVPEDQTKLLWKAADKSGLPHKPGVYIYRNNSSQVIYVGKAIDLHNRVSSYFTGAPDSEKTAALIEHVKSCEVIEVASELEALILEANLIKKYLPQYNIKLTDDKDYLYIKITREPFPKVLTARKNELDDAKEFFGPFPSSRIVQSTLKRLRRIFPWCTAGDHSWLRGRPCFYYHLGLCPGVCAGKISKEEYAKIIRHFSQFMQGKKEELIKSLTAEMERDSKNLDFEKAQITKKMIFGLDYLTQANNASVYLEDPNFIENQSHLALEKLKQDLHLSQLPERIECYDISNIQGKSATGSLVVLTSGNIDKKWYRKFKIFISGKPNDTGMMREMVGRRVKHDEWPTPDLILVDGGRGQVRAVSEVILKRGWKMPVLGLAKRMEWLYTPGEEIIKLPKSSLSLRILQRIRDEAHRVAITYHRKLRSRAFLGSF
jgi:excinuclease ABC subunit C